jgi:hypothetical protein
MVKMVSMKRTQGERKAVDEALGEKEPDGIDIHLDHHHLKKLGGENFEKGHKIKLRAHGRIGSTSEHDGMKSARLRITHMGAAPLERGDEKEEEEGERGDETHGGVREEITRAFGESKAREEAKAKGREAKAGKKLPEAAGAK